MKSGGSSKSNTLSVGAPAIFSDLLRSVQMLKREWRSESNGKLPYLFISSKTATLVPEFAVEDLPLDRTSNLVTAFAVKDLPLGRTLMMMNINGPPLEMWNLKDYLKPRFKHHKDAYDTRYQTSAQ